MGRVRRESLTGTSEPSIGGGEAWFRGVQCGVAGNRVDLDQTLCWDWGLAGTERERARQSARASPRRVSSRR
jgi:hypothetical protein